MSVRALSSLAIARDVGTPTNSSRSAKKKGTAKPQEVRGDADATATAGEALVAAIPTEPLALYTGLSSAIVALVVEGVDSTNSYLPLRWWLFGVWCALVVLWVVGGYVTASRKSTADAVRRRVPVPEVLTALLAFAAWGLIMPESPLRTSLDGKTEAVTTLCLTVGAAAVVYLFAQWGLTQPAKKAR